MQVPIVLRVRFKVSAETLISCGFAGWSCALGVQLSFCQDRKLSLINFKVLKVLKF